MCLYTGGSTSFGIHLHESMADDRKEHMYDVMTNQQYIKYCEIIINRGVLNDFRGFRGSLKTTKIKSNVIQFSH